MAKASAEIDFQRIGLILLVCILSVGAGFGVGFWLGS